MIDKILAKLNQEEYGLFINETGAGTNSRKIAAMLRKDPHIRRDEVFKRVFRSKMEEQNDVLLRNEMSILKKKLENFILKNSVTDIPSQSTYYRSYVMAQWCLKRSLIDEAEKYLNISMKLALKQDAWKGMLQINKLMFQTSQYTKSDYQFKLSLLSKLADDHHQYLQNFISEEVAYADYIRAGAYKLASNLRKTETAFQTTSHFSMEIQHTKGKIAEYYYLKSLAYSTSGYAAIKYLEKAMDCLNNSQELLSKEEELISCQASIAMEYSILGDLEEAIQNYVAVITSKEFRYFGARHSVLFNYSTTLLKLREFKMALQYLNELENLDIEPIVKERIYSMKCNCYIFMEDAKGLKKLLPKNLQSFDLSVRTYYRFLYLIYYLIKQDHEFAERELVNIGNIRGFASTGYMPLHHLFRRYIDAYNAKFYKEKDTSKKMRVLKEELNNLISLHPTIAQLLPAVWIQEKTVALMGNS